MVPPVGRRDTRIYEPGRPSRHHGDRGRRRPCRHRLGPAHDGPRPRRISHRRGSHGGLSARRAPVRAHTRRVPPLLHGGPHAAPRPRAPLLRGAARRGGARVVARFAMARGLSRGGRDASRRLTPKNIFAFYSFGFRWAHGFDAAALFGSEPRVAPASFWRSLFLGARLARPRVGDHQAAATRATRG